MGDESDYRIERMQDGKWATDRAPIKKEVKMNNEITVLESNLSVRFNDKAVADLSEQRKALVKFVQSQLKKDVDYGIIPGVKKPSLYKPGAEKLANLFQLGSRIIKQERTLDLKENYAEFDITIEVFHLPTGKAISQCNAISNSQEKRNANRAIGDLLNTMSKMAQKRAYVGAIIIAVGASDFFTHDVEDMDLGTPPPQKNMHAPSNMQPGPDEGDPNAVHGYVIPFGKFAKRSLEEVPLDQLRNYVHWLEENSQKKGQPLGAMQIDFIDRASDYIVSIERGPSEDAK